jgi:ribonuclease T2
MEFDRKAIVAIAAAFLVIIVAIIGQRGGDDEEKAVPLPTPAVEVQASRATSSAQVPQSTGDFDFYLLVLSWSPTHCSSDAGRGRDDDLQCRAGRPYGFVLHGLWPQHERGYPENCASQEPRRVAAEVMEAALRLSPSHKLVQHEWEKHGTCSGLSQEDYFAAARLAIDGVNVPRAYETPQQIVFTTANDVKRAFLDANPALSPGGILATCRGNEIGEVRVCLDKELRPRACSREVLKKHCGGRDARMLAVRGHWPRD